MSEKQPLTRDELKSMRKAANRLEWKAERLATLASELGKRLEGHVKSRDLVVKLEGESDA